MNQFLQKDLGIRIEDRGDFALSSPSILDPRSSILSSPFAGPDSPGTPSQTAPGGFPAAVSHSGLVSAGRDSVPPALHPGRFWQGEDRGSRIEDRVNSNDGVEKLVSRQAHTLEIAGSSPAPETKARIEDLGSRIEGKTENWTFKMIRFPFKRSGWLKSVGPRRFVRFKPRSKGWAISPSILDPKSSILPLLDDIGPIILAAVLWITAAVLFAGCAATKYEVRDPATGRIVSKFQTRGNIGIVTSQVAGSNSRSGGIPLLNGGYVNNDTTSAVENTSTQNAGITFPDGTQIRGTIDHSTPANVQGQWLWRCLRSLLTAATYIRGFEAYEGVQVAQEVTARTAAKTAATTNQAEIAARTQQAQIEANKAVQLKELETVPE